MILLRNKKYVVFLPIDTLKGAYKNNGEFDTHKEAKEVQEEIYQRIKNN